MSTYKINLKEQTATSINGIRFKLTETKPGEYEGVCLNPKDIPPDDMDDVVGLNRGFLYAGAKSIVGSLWEVPDNPTKDLMVGLYTNLKSMGLREAMRKAQLSALKKYKHPHKWAAFQVTGGT